MELAVGRLMDKSINAVKSAIQLLAAFIAHNPYSCKVGKKNIIPAVNNYIILTLTMYNCSKNVFYVFL